jgi:uncharacterized Zn finger protein
MGRDLHYDLMLEVEGVLRSRRVRMRFDRELELGETLELDGRRWRVAGVHPGRSLHVDRRVVAREIVEPAREIVEPAVA